MTLVKTTTGSMIAIRYKRTTRENQVRVYINQSTSRHVAHVAVASWAYVMEMRLTLVDAADVGLIFCVA